MWQELGAAWALEKPVLSVCTEPYIFAKLPVELKHIKCVNFRDLDNPKELNDTVAGLLNTSDKKGEERSVTSTEAESGAGAESKRR
jgi:hypothetical protein